MGSITIGVSGSANAHPAIEWGVAYAVAHNLHIELVHVVDSTLGLIDEHSSAEVAAADARIFKAANHVTQEHPGLSVRGVVLVGSPAQELLSAAKHADLLVIGSHPTDSFAGGQAHSRRAVRLAEHADSTVVVVPAEPDRHTGTGFVVGVDGSELSMKALRFAATEAERLREPLTAVHTWALPWTWGLDYAPPWPETPPDDAQRVLAESLAGLAEDFPDLAVQRTLPLGPPAQALHVESRGARMLAVGSHGRSGLGRAWFGSVSAEVLLTMPCTVAIVR